MRKLSIRKSGGSRDDAGFTLPELLITIAILGVVMVALSAAFIVVVRTNQATSDRMSQSHDAQLVANYLVADAQSASGVGVSTTPLCGATGAVALSLTWPAVDGSFAASTRSVSYTLSGPASGQTLTRWICGGPSGSSHTTVSHDVLSVGQPSCTGGNAICGAGSTATGLAMTITEASGAASPYKYYLNVAFRKSSGAPTASVQTYASLPFVALGSGTCVTLNGNHDDIQIPSGTSAGANCTFSGNGNVTWPGPGSPAASVNTSGGCGTLSNCNSPTPPIADPYASLLASSPPSSAVNNTTITSCPSNGHLVPGNYNSLTLSNCILDSGIYVIHGSLTISGTVTSGLGGVLLYFDGAQGAPSLNIGNNDLLLAPMTSGTWKRFSIIMKGPGSLGLGGNGSLRGPNGPTYATGIVYAPNSAVTLGGNGEKRVEQLIIGSATGNGGGSGGGFWAGCTALGAPSFCS